MHISKWLFAILVSLLLVGCGGDDDDSTTTPAATAAPDNSQNNTTVNSQNSATIAGTAFKRLFSTFGAGNALSNVSTNIGTDLVGGVNIDDVSFNLLDYANRQMAKNSEVSVSLASGIVITENDLPCDESGTNDFSWADNDGNEELSVGDTFTIISYDCVEDGETTNGEIFFTLLEDEPNIAMSFAFTDFEVVGIEGTSTFDGDLTLQVKESGSTESISITSNKFDFSDPEMDGIFRNLSITVSEDITLESLVMTADELTINEGGVTETLTDFSLTFTEDNNTSLSTLALNGVFDDPELGGIFSVNTLKPFEGLASDDFPYTGILKVIASDDSSVTLTALDTVNVRLDVDEDGDGSTDQTSDTTWSSLDI